MNRMLKVGVALLTCIVVSQSSPARAAEFIMLLKRIPSDTNLLVMVDVDRLMASPIAESRGWKKKLSQDFSQRPLLLPPSAHKLVRAMAIDLNSQATSSEITLLEMPKGLSLAKIAERHQGYVEKVANVDAAWFPQGAYGVKLTDELLGLMFPSNRQNLARWIRDKSGQASTYLQDAARDMKPKGPQIEMAIDLEDLISPNSLEERVQELESLSESKNDLKAITKILEGIRGAKFSVTFDTKANARLLVNFDRDASVLKPIAKPLLLEVLSNRGLLLDEAEDWKVTLEGRELTFTGELQQSGLMRLSSLFELPADLIDDPEQNTDADNPMLYATQAHYKSVQTLLDDLFAKPKQSFGQYAQFAEQYAKKIDRLPLLNVDKDMQEYSSRVSSLLRNGSEAFKGVGIRSAGRQSQVWTTSYVTYGYNGVRNYDASGQEKRAIRGQEKARGASDAAEMKRLLDEESNAIRKVMVDRYKVEF